MPKPADVIRNMPSPLAWGRGSKRMEPRPPATRRSRPSRGGVDRNAYSLAAINMVGLSPLAWGRGSKP